MESRPSRLGRYELLGEIASGGMASVYFGRRIGSAGFERTVAVKLLHRHLAKNPDFVAMFVDEARLAGRIRHPNVVDVHDVERIDDDLMLVMSYVEGVSLWALLARLRQEERPMPIPIALRVVHDALLGLHAAHELSDARGDLVGLIHRDVSPQNILVGIDGATRVTDFGVARAAGRLAATRSDVIKGKIGYLAPEQLRPGPLDRRVDVFAAGIVLWECLTGRALFRGESDAETFQRVMSDPIPPPSVHSSGVRLAVDEVCTRALERDPNRRYQTAAQFAEAIEGAATREPLAALREVGAFVASLVGEVVTARRQKMFAAHGDEPIRPRPADELRITEGRGFTARMELEPDDASASTGPETSLSSMGRRTNGILPIAVCAVIAVWLAWIAARSAFRRGPSAGDEAAASAAPAAESGAATETPIEFVAAPSGAAPQALEPPPPAAAPGPRGVASVERRSEPAERRPSPPPPRRKRTPADYLPSDL